MSAAVVAMDDTTRARLRAYIRERFADDLRRGKPALHTYTDASGAPIFWRLRIKFPGGAKLIRPIRANGSGYEIGEPKFDAGRKPLYRLHELADAARRDEPVVVVEGESCADALAALGVIATTSGGASSAGAADWTPLRGRRVVVWPDADAAGAQYGRDVAAAVLRLGCSVEVVRVDALGLPAGGDAVDWMAAHADATRDDVLALPRDAASAAGEPDGGVALIRGDRIEIEPVRWVWRGWLALGKLHILAGAPSTGKTTTAMSLAATITREGARFPDGSGNDRARDVLIWSGEDAAGDTLAPRLIAMGADMSRVHFVRDVRDADGVRPFDPATDMPRLLDAAAGLDLGLTIIDPVVLAVVGDSHKNAEVRRGLQPLCDLAAALRCAALGISHYTKGTQGRDPVERVSGSLAFGAVARIVLGAARRPDDQGGGAILVRAKSNLGLDGGGYEYRIEPVTIDSAHGPIETTRVRWGAPIEGTARELLAAAEPADDDDERQQRRDAEAWLTELLADGPMPAREVERLSREAGYAWRTVQRARAALGIEPRRDGFGRGATYVWGRPMRATDPPCVPCMPDMECGTHGTHDGAHGAHGAAGGDAL